MLVGRPMQSEHLGHTLLPKKIALPVFASDALSSVAYATEEILLVLSLGGIALLHYTPYIGAAVGLLMLVVVASYRQNVHAYPSGGGDYEVASTNLGPKVGPGGRERADGRLHADGGGLGLGRRGEPGLGVPGPGHRT